MFGEARSDCDNEDRARILKQIYGESIHEERLKYEQVINQKVEIDLETPEQEIAKAS